MSEENENEAAEESEAEPRTLPQIIEVYGSARDIHTRALRRRSRDKRHAFRLAGTWLVRPGRSFEMTLHVARKHADEILKRMQAGQVQLRKHGKAFTIEECRAALLGESPAEPETDPDKDLFDTEVETKIMKLAEMASELEPENPVPAEQVQESISKAKTLPESEREEFLTQLNSQLEDAAAALKARSEAPSEPETPQEPSEDTETAEDAPTEPSEPETAEGSEDEPTDETAEDDETEDEGSAEPTEEVTESEKTAVPGDMRLPDGYEKFKKDDLFDLYAEREDFGLDLPEDTRNDSLVQHLADWAENVVFED